MNRFLHHEPEFDLMEQNFIGGIKITESLFLGDSWAANVSKYNNITSINSQFIN